MSVFDTNNTRPIPPKSDRPELLAVKLDLGQAFSILRIFYPDVYPDVKRDFSFTHRTVTYREGTVLSQFLLQIADDYKLSMDQDT